MMLFCILISKMKFGQMEIPQEKWTPVGEQAMPRGMIYSRNTQGGGVRNLPVSNTQPKYQPDRNYSSRAMRSTAELGLR